MPETVELATREWPPVGVPTGARAPTAVLVHGVTGWHRTWWRVGPALAERGWRVVAVDQRGHGRSPRIDGYVTVPGLAADLTAAIEGIGAPVEAVIAHSLGAAVAAELAFRRPELVHRLVLEDPPSIGRADDRAWRAELMRGIEAARADFHGTVARELAEHPDWLPDDARQNVEGRQLVDAPGLDATYRRDTGARVAELVPSLTVPALYLLADDERSVFVGDARRRLLEDPPPTARAVVLDAGHTIHRDRFDAYLEHVLAWIDPAR
jgi:esterase